MNFQEAITYLQDLTKFGFNFGLDRIKELMRRLGNPHEQLKVIHVGGTNGKGSTCIMLSSILQEAGFRVGLFTSPHLHSYTERYRINRQEIAPERVAQLITNIKPILEEMVASGFEHPTEFEVSTALAFQYFAEEQVDFLVLEVGLGGLIDSTNVVTPLISVITNVTMDHMDYLGNTIEEIATIKAGIIKPGRPVITAADKPAVLKVIQETCGEKGSALTILNQEVEWQLKEADLAGQRFAYHGLGHDFEDLNISLLGKHQLVNAATAITIVLKLVEQGFAINLSAVPLGLQKAVWPGRLEIVQRHPMVVIDGAHNVDGAVSLANSLTQVFNYQKLILVFGMLGDKEREKVVSILAPLANKVVITKPNNPRAGDWRQLASEVQKYVAEVYLEEDVNLAVKKAINLAEEHDLVCVTGSLYMISQAREIWSKQAQI